VSTDLELFSSLFAERARAVGLAFDALSAITGNSFGTGDAATTRLGPDQLPDLVYGCLVGRHPLILGILPKIANAESVFASVRRYRNQCVVARSNLTADQALDLNLFLLGPAGSDNDEQWKALGATIERDDRVARKQVWLRPLQADANEDSFRLFCERTFMARPWLKGHPIEAQLALDPIEELFTDEGGPAGVGRNWFGLADGDIEPGPDLVEALITQYRDGA